MTLRSLVLSAALVVSAAAFTPALAADPAPAPVMAAHIEAPPAGKGQVVFFRPSKFAGAAVSFSVHEGDTGVAKLGNGSYAVVVADPGPHAYTSESESKDVLNVEVDAGETQYIQQTLGMGVIMYRPHLTPSDQATFDAMVGKLKLSSKKPTDLKAKPE